MARTSAADLSHALRGADFPMGKDGLIKHAKENGAPEEILKTIQRMPDANYESLAGVEHEFSQVSKKSSGASPESTGEARKGGHHNRGRSR